MIVGLRRQAERARFRLLPLALAALSACACACAGRPGEALPPGENQRDPAAEQRYADDTLAAILKPDRALADAYFTKDERGFVTYRAVLAEPAPKGFAEQYYALLRSRGVIHKPIGTSPHAFPFRALGYYTYVFHVEAPSPLTVRHIQFDSKDWAWLDAHPLRSAPEPLAITASALSLTLGRPGEWVSQVLLPDRDVLEIKELPLERYPGAVLRRVSPLEDRELRSGADVQRSFVLERGGMQSVVDHYARQLRAMGATGVQGTNGSLFWTGEPLAKMVKVSISRRSIGLVDGSGLSLLNLLEAMPSLRVRVPKGFLTFDVNVYWQDPADRVPFLTPADQARYHAAATR